VPGFVPREKIVQLEWGADTSRFRPDAPGTPPFARRPGRTLAVFAGAFRRWHGAHHLVEALGRLRRRGDSSVDAVLIGDGPERPRALDAARGLDGVTFTGALPHDILPACLAHADIGVAPFDVGRHGPLALDFYWSPLKIFEYMAAGLPVVTPGIPRLRGLVRHEREGLLYDAAQPEALASALVRLTDPDLRARLGRAARARVEAEFSWASHCARLEAAIVAAAGRRQSGHSACAS
jgi:glycosyltransferase involved in cell wall biosynthesis